MSITITCGRAGDLIRAAVWEGKVLRDLYVDRLSTPDFTGALVRGRVVRVLAGQKTAWIEAGLPEKIYVESAKPFKAGDTLTLRIQTTTQEGKAWIGAITKSTEGENTLGIITPPPQVWQRAIESVDEFASLRFAHKNDYEAFVASGLAGKATHEAKDSVHPQLDEMIDALCEPVVPLAGGASLVIEPTAALVAIDVNGGASSNPAATNLLAVREAARQIRLRNLGGIIVIDCLKMANRADASKVVNAFERVAASDPAGIHCYGLNKLGLLEATRTRRGLPLSSVVSDD